jgi:hypothetical protein
VQDAGAHCLAPFVDRAGQERPPARLDCFREGAVDGLEPVRRAAGRPGPERDDRGLRGGREFERGLSLDQRGELARQRVRADDLVDDAGATTGRDRRPRLEGAERPGLLQAVLGEGRE